MTQDAAQFAPFAQRMADEGLPAIFIAHFAHYYEKLRRGDDGLFAERDIRPVRSLDNAERLAPRLTAVGQEAIRRTVIIKLNGGLGTSMGLTGPKSLLVVKEGLTFLDIIARQAVEIGAPLLLMNSFATDAASVAVVEQYPGLRHDLPLSFCQHKQPKIDAATFAPVTWPDDRELEWCPPGHGDLYTALVTSGMLDRLLRAGYEYAFVSNADNLGAVLDPAILGYMADKELPFLMEVADRTTADRKGGHLARRPDGGLLLREIAQCPADDLLAFQDIERHRYFNTNNLWLHLPTLRATLAANNNELDLPMIRNRKTVDPRDPDSTPVYQLETAMGSALAVFEGAEAIRVPRARFAPVKKTDDLLAVRSDAYQLTRDFRVVLARERRGRPPAVELDSSFYRLVDDLDCRFPAGPPSLRECDRLRVEGAFEFGPGVVVRGDVTFRNTSGRCVAVPRGLTVTDAVWPGEEPASSLLLEDDGLKAPAL